MNSVQNNDLTDVRWGWLGATGISVIAIIGIELFAFFFFGLLLKGLAPSFPPAEMIATAFLQNDILVLFIGYVLVRSMGIGIVYAYVRRKGGDFRSLGLRRFKIGKALKVIGLASTAFIIAAAVAGLLIDNFLPSVDLERQQELVFLDARGSLEIALAFLALVIVAPFTEEIIFRGFLFPAYAKTFGVILAAIATSVIFGLLHMPIGAAIIISLFALVLVWAYYKTNSLWPAIIIHSIKNLVAFIAIF